MRILVLSDIHANLNAFEAVLSAAGSFDAIWCLGDTVGYGPDPNECVERLANLPNLTCLIGNHDAAAVGLIDLNAFNREAKLSARWTQNMLSNAHREYIAHLPERVEIEGITLAHGSPSSPIWQYLLDPISARENFACFTTDLCFVGHTHVPLAFRENPDTGFVTGEVIKNEENPIGTGRMILNPGSVGQPRDHNPLAAYAIFNPETHTWRSYRVAYDCTPVQARMKTAGLPAKLIQRIAEGW
jgi:diadenosine tetraphosphatase ApaH/serine/threonine PP2A family protein phosphatase